MKTIGLIGGMGWQSTLDYYRIMNEAMEERTGGQHAAKIVIISLDFKEIELLIINNDFEIMTKIIIAAARKIERAGADLLLIGANTMHYIAQEVQQSIGISLVNITDVTIQKIKEKGLNKIGLLGTKFTMEQNFYKERIREKGIEVVVPELPDRDFIQHTITSELFKAILRPESKRRFLDIINDLVSKGAQGIILGCTEIPILIKQNDCSVPVFDTTEIHAKAAVDLAISTES